jgi:dipeptidyl-peptidase-4
MTMLIFTNSRKVWRKKTRGDYWVLDITARDLRQLGGAVIQTQPSSLMFATFSPSGDKVRQGLLCVREQYLRTGLVYL